jgi:hypothetical protein
VPGEKAVDGLTQLSLKELPMTSILKSTILAAFLSLSIGSGVTQAMSGDKVLDDLIRTGSIVTPHGLNGR